MRRAAAMLCLWICAMAPDVDASHQLVFDVPEEGGIFEIPVHPLRLTVLYFPTSVTSFVHGEVAGVTVRQRQHILTVDVAPGSPTVTLSVDCSLFRAGILLRPVDDPDDAAVQVQFRDLSRRARIQAEVARQLETHRAELDAARATLERERADLAKTREQLDRVVEQKARLQVAAGLRKRLEIEPVKATARTQTHVVARIREVVWLGDDAYVRLSIQNRNDQPYTIQAVGLTADQLDYPVHLVMPHPVAAHPRVPGKSIAQGILVVPKASALTHDVVKFTINPKLPDALRLRILIRK